MKRCFKFLSLVLVLSLLFNTVVCAASTGHIVNSSDDVSSDDDFDLSTLWETSKNVTNLVIFALSEVGAAVDFDFAKYIANQDALVSSWSDSVSVSQDDDGNDVLYVDSSFTDYLLEQLNSYAQENQGYILVPTFKASDFKASNFSSTDYYSSICNYILDKGIAVVCRVNSQYYVCDFSSFINSYYSVCTETSTNKEYFYHYFKFYKSMSSSASNFYLYKIDSSGNVDDSNYYKYTSIYSGDYVYNFIYPYYRDLHNKTSLYSVFFNNPLLVSLTGYSIPAFANLSDAVDYQMSNGIYYTTADYTGVGTDITISLDTLKTITDSSADYSQMYDVLINMIKENEDNGTSLTYDDLATLTKSVIDSMADIKSTIETDDALTNSLLQNILDSLNEFKNKYVPWSSSDSGSGSSLTYTTVLTAIKSNLDTIIDSISSFKSSMEDKLDNIYDMLKSIRNWSIVDTITDLGDMLADWVSFVKDLLDDVESGVAVIVESVSGVADTLSTKFPFSIPWDIAFLIAFLAETPKAPVFEVPFNFPLYGIEYTFTFDFSQFEAVSKISRLILTMLFSLGLLKLTNNIVSTKKR